MPPPPRYRDLQRQALIDTSVVDTGEAAAARELGNALRSFERLSGGIYGSLRTEQGRREGAEAGRTANPDLRQGMAALTAYGRAYNDSALRSYAIKSEIAADETAARLESEVGNDPEAFRARFGAFRDETIKAAPPGARAVLGEVYDRRMASGMSRIITAQQAEMKEQDRADLAEGIQRAADRAARLRATNDPIAQAQADEEELKLDLLISGAQNDGTISVTEAGAFRTDADRSIVAQTVLAKFRNELDSPYGNPIAFLERLRAANKTSELLPPEAEEKLADLLLAELQQRTALENAARSHENAAQQARFDAGNQTATSLLLGGALTQAKIKEMVDSEDLDPNRATSLFNELTEGPTAKSNPQTLFDYEVNLLSYSEDDISTERGLTPADKSRLILKRREWESGWRGTQEGREAADRLDRALGIPPGWEGKLLSGPEKTKRERALTHWYNAVDALPAADRQKALIPLAEETIKVIIKDTAMTKLETLRQRREELLSNYGPEDQLNKTQRKSRDQDLAEFDRQIALQEQKAK